MRMVELPRAILFDMDGTITEPLLDFARIKLEMGIGERPILEALGEMAPEQRRAAEAILARHEREAAARSTLSTGCDELLGWLAERGIGTGLITRNSRVSMETVVGYHRLGFDVLISREDGRYKPDPEPLMRACRRLKVAPGETWMVGDGQYDVEAGLAAGARPVWVSHGRSRSFAAAPWMTVRNLVELTGVLRACLP